MAYDYMYSYCMFIYCAANYFLFFNLPCLFFQYIINEGPVFTFKTNFKAPRYKLINIDFTKPEMVGSSIWMPCILSLHLGPTVLL